jgi:CheY-like chemotaxis protein
MVERSQPMRRPPSGVRPRGPLVLIVEGEDALRELCAAELASAGFMVLEASDGATGIEKAFQFGPHAVVLDLILPGVDGFKVARRLRSDDRTHDVALIALTGLASPKFEQLAFAAGFDGFLGKPAPAAALIEELLEQLAKRGKSGSRPDLSRVARGASGTGGAAGPGLGSAGDG